MKDDAISEQFLPLDKVCHHLWWFFNRPTRRSITWQRNGTPSVKFRVIFDKLNFKIEKESSHPQHLICIRYVIFVTLTFLWTNRGHYCGLNRYSREVSYLTCKWSSTADWTFTRPLINSPHLRILRPTGEPLFGAFVSRSLMLRLLINSWNVGQGRFNTLLAAILKRFEIRDADTQKKLKKVKTIRSVQLAIRSFIAHHMKTTRLNFQLPPSLIMQILC